MTAEPPIPPEDLEAAKRYAERLRDGDGEDPTAWLERADVRESLGRHTRRFAEHPDFFDAIEAVRRRAAAEGDAVDPTERDGT